MQTFSGYTVKRWGYGGSGVAGEEVSGEESTDGGIEEAGGGWNGLPVLYLFSQVNSDLSRAIARLKGDRSPFNTSSSDLPEIASDFRAANLQGSLFCSGRQAPCRKKGPARGVHAAAYD